MTLERSELSGFALDLGGTKIAAARIEAGQVVDRSRCSTDGAAAPAAQVAAMGGLLASLGFRRGDPLAVAVAGRIDRNGIWSAVNTGTLSAVAGVDLAGAVDDAIGPATCLNDGAAAAAAEARFGAGQDQDNFAYITVSTGVGGGLVLGGRLLQGASGLSGHVGFVTSPLAEGRCGSGRTATVESVAGGRAIAAAARAAGHDADARAVAQAAQTGAAWADAIIARSAGAIALLIADLTTALGLDGAALGGSIGLSPGYADRVRRALAREPALFRVPVGLVDLGHDGPLLGALACHLDREVT